MTIIKSNATASRPRLALAIASLLAATGAHAGTELTGWALLPANTFAEGPNGGNNIPVDALSKSRRLLTGSDLDIEAVRQDKRGILWLGDEFDPFLVKIGATGKALRAEISLPGVQAPQNPHPAGAVNLGRSRGFEGMAINASGERRSSRCLKARSPANRPRLCAGTNSTSKAQAIAMFIISIGSMPMAPTSVT